MKSFMQLNSLSGTNTLCDMFNNIVEYYSQSGENLNFREIAHMESVYNFDRAPVLIYGVKYENDILYTAKFIVCNHLIGNICPYVGSFEGVLKDIIARIKRSYNSAIHLDGSRDIFIASRIFDLDSVIYNTDLFDRVTITLETVPEDVLYSKEKFE